MNFLSLVRAGSWGGGWSEHPTQDRKLDEKEEEKSLRKKPKKYLRSKLQPTELIDFQCIWRVSTVSKSLNLGRQFLFGKIKRK